MDASQRLEALQRAYTIKIHDNRGDTEELQLERMSSAAAFIVTRAELQLRYPGATITNSGATFYVERNGRISTTAELVMEAR